MTDLLTASAPVSAPTTEQPDHRPRVDRAGWLRRLAAACWPYLVPVVLLSVLFGRTLQPSTGNRFSVDTTKFDYLGLVLGTAHPPGYPLYTMADAVIVRLVPFGTVAFRANLLSAVCTVLMAVALVDVLLTLAVRAPLAATGATMIGLMPAIWQFSVVAEVYTMTAMFVALVLLCLVRYEAGRERIWLRLGVLVLALSFAHATADVLLIPGLAVYLLVRRIGWLFRPRELARLLPASAALALLPYGYLFWRTAARATFLDVRVDSLSTFVETVSGARYGPAMFAVPASELPGRLSEFGAAAGVQLGLLLWASLAGVLVLVVRRGLLAGVLVLWALCTAVFTLWYDVPDWLTMLLPLWLVVGLAAVIGIDGAVNLVSWPLRRTSGTALAGGALAQLLAAATGIAVLTSVATTGYPLANQSGDHSQDDVDRAVDAAGQHAVIFTPDNSTRHQFFYRLLPDRRGARLDVWAAKGTGSARHPFHYSAQIRSYCASTVNPWPWSTQEQAAGPGVPRGLRTYLYSPGYAARVRKEGLKVTRVTGRLYRVSCPR